MRIKTKDYYQVERQRLGSTAFSPLRAIHVKQQGTILVLLSLSQVSKNRELKLDLLSRITSVITFKAPVLSSTQLQESNIEIRLIKSKQSLHRFSEPLDFPGPYSTISLNWLVPSRFSSTQKLHALEMFII